MMLSARAGALVSCAALLDALVASAGGSLAASLAIASCLLLAVIGIVFAWRRPTIAFAAAWLACAGAFAIETFGRIANGPSFTGMDANDSSALVLAASVVLAGVCACLAFSSPLVRGIVAILALYGAVSVAWSIGRGGLGAAFGTPPFAFIGGAYLASEVFLPVGAAAALGVAGAAAMQRHATRAVTALFVVFASLAAANLGARAAGSAGLPTIVAFESPLAQSTNANASDFDPETGARFVPKNADTVAPEVVAASATIGKSVDAALSAVASLGDDLYPGALGGAVGALRSGSANSVDKALLLRDVLRTNMPTLPLEFARCALADTDADAFVAQIRAAKAPPAIVLQAAGTAAQQVSDATTRATLTRWDAAWKTLVTQTRDEGKKLGSALATSGLQLASNSPDANRTRALAADHVWLRAQLANGWTDLDPTLPNAVPGKSRCAPASQSATLADDSYDVVGVRVVSETATANSQRRDVLLDRTIRTADLGDRDLDVMFAEPVGLETQPSPPPAPAATSGDATFTPIMRIGDETIAGTPLTVPSPPEGGGLGAKIGAMASVFDTPAPATATPDAAMGTALSGLWLELSIASPSGPPSIVRSPIFDRIGFAARLGHAHPQLAPALRTADYRALQTVWNIAVMGGATPSAGGAAAKPSGSGVDALATNLASLNASFATLRRALANDARGSSIAEVSFKPGLTLLAFTDDGLRMDVSSDASLPLGADEMRPLWSAASVIAERTMLDAQGVLSGDSITGNQDALVALDRSDTTAGAMRAFGPRDASAIAALAIDDDAKARLAAHVNDGASVLALAPESGAAGDATFAWILEANGTLRDENGAGRHQVAEEATVDNEVAVKNVSTWRKFTCTIMPKIRVVTVVLSAAMHGSPFSPATLGGLAAGNAAETKAAVEAAQDSNPANIAGGCP